MDPTVDQRGDWSSEAAFPWFVDRIQRAKPGDIVKFRDNTEGIILVPKLFDRRYETAVPEDLAITWGDAINTLEQNGIITLETPGIYRRTTKLSSEDPRLSDFDSARLSELTIGRDSLDYFVKQTQNTRITESAVSDWFRTSDVECFEALVFNRLFYNFPRDTPTEERTDLSEYLNQLSNDLLPILASKLPKKVGDIAMIQDEASIDKKVQEICTELNALVKQHDLAEKSHVLNEIVQNISKGILRAMRRHMILSVGIDSGT